MKKTRFSFFAALSLIVLPLTLLSQWSTNPAVNNAICNLPGDQALPKIATCSNGDTYIGYYSNESGNYNMRLQRLDSQGNILWAANGILISDHPQETWLTDWDMTCDGSNYAILAFNDIRIGTTWNIVAYRIAPDGSFSWGANGIQLSSNTATNAAPKVAVTAAGNTVVAWQSDNVTIIQKISSAGVLQWGANGITLSGTPRITWPQLLPVGTDDVILKYFEDIGPVNAPTRHVLAQRYNGSGSPVWATPATVSNAGGISAWTQIFPFINDGSDGFYIAWHDDRDNNQRASTFVQHVSSSGVVLFTANGVEASGLSSMNHYYPQLALPSGSTDIFVFWNEMNNNQDQWGLSGQKISSSGSLLWGSNGMTFIGVSTTDVYPIAARRTPTDMVLFYEQYFNSVNSAIKAMRISTTGSFVWSPSSVTMCSVNSEKVHDVVNEFANNQWIASWEDNRNGNSDIYAQNISLAGTLGPTGTGTISGTITLNGGTGNVTQVLVQAGSTTTNPDATGHYSMVVSPGTYTVNATLSGYYPASQTGVIVTTNQTTTVNLTLNPIPAGNVDGLVTLVGGAGNVHQVVVTVGTATTNPDAAGHYNISVLPGTYNVIATLPGYYPDTVYGVTVVNGQTVYNIDLTLTLAPTTGFIEGTVTLAGGSGDVTQAVVSAGTSTTHPDATGFYSMELTAGYYDVSASLTGYVTQLIVGVQVIVNQVTDNVNFTLVPESLAGTIQGQVTLTGGTADVTLTTISSGSYVTYPDNTGFYSLMIPQGTYSVTASNPYTTSQTIDNVTVQPGQITPGVDFILTVNRADMICIAYNMYGDILNGVDVVVEGPEGPYTGTITQDSLVFPHVPYGTYNGIVTYAGIQFPSDTTINAVNHYLIFECIVDGIDPKVNPYGLHVIPNPTGMEGIILFNLNVSEEITLYLSDSKGRFIKLIDNKKFDAGKYRLPLNEILKDQLLTDGIYFLSLHGDRSSSTGKMIFRNRH